MKRKEALRLLKRTLSLDERHACTATYTDAGMFRASLWPAGKTGQSIMMRERLLLIGRSDVSMEENDRVESAKGLYRILWVRRFPKHEEALLEKEDPQG